MYYMLFYYIMQYHSILYYVMLYHLISYQIIIVLYIILYYMLLYYIGHRPPQAPTPESSTKTPPRQAFKTQPVEYAPSEAPVFPL